jgi:kynurenine formamidase
MVMTNSAGRTRNYTASEFDYLFDSVKNWGRWGEGDDRGTLNYISPDKVRQAAALVREGLSISMALPVNTTIGPDNPKPALHHMCTGHEGPEVPSVATDFFGTQIHGNCHTHLDALSHIAYRDRLYNGLPAHAVTTAGAQSLDVTAYASGLVGRGVLIDIPRLRGVAWVEPGEAVTAAEIATAEDARNVTLGEGDILVFRTGHHRRRLEHGPWDNSSAGQGRAGLDLTAIRMLHERRVAAFLPDGDGETVPSPVSGVSRPIHALQIAAMGMAAGDNLNLEDIAAACASRNRYEFLVVASVLRIPGATGSPCNPIAIL